MFGYFRPYQSDLTQGELNLFSAYYCRICYCLRILGGQFARFFTTYDVAVYSIIINLQKGEEHPPVLPCERLGTKNMKAFENDQTGLKFARLSLISFGEKFRDDAIDEGGGKTRLVAKFFKKTIDAARQAEPEMTQVGVEGIAKINALQNQGAPVLEVLAAYGDMAIKSFSTILELTPETAALIKSVSEWVFFVDMICDYEEDYKSNAYNGLLTPGLPTFVDYFNVKYNEFMALEGKITGNMVNALLNAKQDTRLYNTLFKIIMNAVNTVIPYAIEGKDISYHYFKDVWERYSQMHNLKSEIRRLGLENK